MKINLLAIFTLFLFLNLLNCAKPKLDNLQIDITQIKQRKIVISMLGDLAMRLKGKNAFLGVGRLFQRDVQLSMIDVITWELRRLFVGI